MRVLVCGSRTFSDERIVSWVLEGVHYMEHSPDTRTVIIEGGAVGADMLAAEWVHGFGNEYPMPHEKYPADWNRHGKAAGPIRNRRMLEDSQPDVVFAFIDKPLDESRGTHDMVTVARAAGVPVYVIQVMP